MEQSLVSCGNLDPSVCLCRAAQAGFRCSEPGGEEWHTGTLHSSFFIARCPVGNGHSWIGSESLFFLCKCLLKVLVSVLGSLSLLVMVLAPVCHLWRRGLEAQEGKPHLIYSPPKNISTDVASESWKHWPKEIWEKKLFSVHIVPLWWVNSGHCQNH